MNAQLDVFPRKLLLFILILARMPVPKMVKNGLNSSFVFWGQFWALRRLSVFLQCPPFSNCGGLS